jgi:hypothetical protein
LHPKFKCTCLKPSAVPERIFTAAGLPDNPKLLVLPGN